jgi:S-adenosylmethionine:tRNA ribosyltransferase-isomerase
MGVKAKQNPTATLQELELKQWDAYDHKWNAYETKRDEALTALLDWMSRHNSTQLICKTQILIAPPYQLKMADALITNFHQPNSTLLLLVAAVVGEDWKTIYDYALANDFRFLSYGDGSLLFAR